MEGDFNKFTFSQRLNDALFALHIATDSAFVILWPAMGKDLKDEVLHDAHHLAQIIALRSATILRLGHAEGYPNATDSNCSLKPTLDPASIWGLVRAQYEAFAVFNNIFVQHKGDEQAFLYRLWVVSGLKYRQQFRKPLSDERIPHELAPELLAKADRELKIIEDLVMKVEQSTLYQNLTQDKQGEINEALKRKDFKFFFKGGVPIKQAWHELFNRTITSDVFATFYTYMSLWSHPSNVSAFSFKDIYSSGEADGQVQRAVNFAAFILAFMLRDKMSLFPECRQAFETLPPPHQVLLDGWNDLFRGDDMRIVRIPML
ncbi:MAG: hypothetical protein ACOH13_10275 [Flavobacteriales bacterium]